MKKTQEFIDSIKPYMYYGETELRRLEKEVDDYLSDDDIDKTDKQIAELKDILIGLREEIYENYEKEYEEPIDEEKYYYRLGDED